MALERITSDLATTMNASDGAVARKIAEHLGLLRDADGRIFAADGQQVATDLYDLYDTFSSLMWTSPEMLGAGNIVRHIHWQRITGVTEVVAMARRRGRKIGRSELIR